MERNTEIGNTDEIIDSRDIIEDIEELKEELKDEDKDAEEIEDIKEKLLPLKALAEEGENYSEDWKHGAQLIRDSYFVEYAEEFASDIGAIKIHKDAQWPLMHIDWDAAADDLKQDYTEIDFDGVAYWIR